MPISTPPPSTPPSKPPPTSPPGTPARQATFAQTLSAVLWSFFGVRKGKDMQRDAASLNPVHVILIGVGMAALVVVGLLLLVRTIVH